MPKALPVQRAALVVLPTMATGEQAVEEGHRLGPTHRPVLRGKQRHLIDQTAETVVMVVLKTPPPVVMVPMAPVPIPG